MEKGNSYDPLLKQVYGDKLKDLQKGKRYFSKIRTKIKKIKKKNSEHYTKKD